MPAEFDASHHTPGDLDRAFLHWLTRATEVIPAAGEPSHVATAIANDRPALVRRGLLLNYLTIAYNVVEAIVSVAAGVVSGSVALVTFGVDSAIEVTSSLAAHWRLRADLDPERRERAERATHRIIGWSFLTLAAYIIVESVATLWQREAPQASRPNLPLCLPLRHSAGWGRSERRSRLVVGRPGGRITHGPHHRQGRAGRRARSGGVRLRLTWPPMLSTPAGELPHRRAPRRAGRNWRPCRGTLPPRRRAAP